MNCFDKYLIVCLTAFISFSCVTSPRFAERDNYSADNKNTQQPDRTRKNNSGKILLTLEGVVSYYGTEFNGKQTSNGEIYDMNALTAAHRNFPFGTKVRVTNLENNRSVIVRVNDRGPFKEGRIMDLSMGAAKEIDLVLNGTTRARLEVIEWGNGQ